MTSSASFSSSSCLPSERIAQLARQSKILVVGAGGIGCELVKNLALLSFAHVQVIDLDTIDVSNLNRQLLFRRPHVGQPKCTVSCDVAYEMIACMNAMASGSSGTGTTSPAQPGQAGEENTYLYKAHHGNVCDNTFFHVPFVKAFDLVLNALDNVTARRRVNRICLAAGVPLIEAGTTGYLGQVNVIDVASQTACFECQTVETPTVYPICTIRSTPTQPVHTIVWAKECYKLLFHDKVQESMLYEDENTPTTPGDGNGENGNEKETTSDDNGNNSGEPSTYMQSVLDLREALRPSNNMSNGGSSSSNDGDKESTITAASLLPLIQKVLETLYHVEIQKQLDMGRYKTSQTTPTPLPLDIIQQACSSNGNKKDTSSSSSSSTSSTAIWTLAECLTVLVEGIVQTTATKPLQTFDKDDDFAMKFVTAASNLRSHVFQIEPLQSYYSAKGIAGNIIPAIATTNAIAAGLQIMQALQILNAQQKLGEKTGILLEQQEVQANGTANANRICSYLNILRNPTRNGLYITAGALARPNPDCFVCRNALVSLAIDVDRWKLDDFLSRIVKQELGFAEPTLLLEGGSMIWEEGEDADAAAFTKNLQKKLSELPSGGIVHGCVLRVEDFSQDLTIDIAVTQKSTWDDKNNEQGEPVDDLEQFDLGRTSNHHHHADQKPAATTTENNGTTVAASAATAADSKPSAAEEQEKEDDDNDDVCMIVDGPTDDDADETTNGKRRAKSSNKDDGNSPKRAKKQPSSDDVEVIDIE